MGPYRAIIVAAASMWVTTTLPEKSLSQPAGNPIHTESDRKFTLAFNSGYLTTDIFGVKNKSPRFLLKGIYGLADRLDLFGEMGFAKVNLTTSQPPPAEYKDTFHLAVGGGFTLRFLEITSMRTSLFVGGQVFRFKSNPTSEKNLVLGGSDVKQVVELEYDWREAIVNTGLVERLGRFKVYTGLNTKLIQRKELRISRNVISGNIDSEIIQRGQYESGLQLSPFFGIDLALPSRYLLSAEFIGRSKTSFILSLGISQTGKP